MGLFLIPPVFVIYWGKVTQNHKRMVYSVLKRSGASEPFISDKIRSSIEGAVRDSGIPQERTGNVTDEIHYEVITSLPREKEVTTHVIRTTIVTILSVKDETTGYRSMVLSAWMEHERRFKTF